MRDRPRERNEKERAGTEGYTLTDTNTTHSMLLGPWCPCITVVKRHKVRKLTSVVGEHSHIRKGF